MSVVSGGVSRLVGRTGGLAVDLSIVKDHLQLTHNVDDDLLQVIVEAAIEEVENRGSVALTTQQRRFYFTEAWATCIAGRTLHLPYHPVQSVQSVTYLDSDGDEQDFTDFRLVAGESIYFASRPTSLIGGDGSIWVDYTCGFGSSYAQVPAAWRQLVNQLCYRRYEYRDTTDGGNSPAWERAFDRQIVAAGGERRG